MSYLLLAHFGFITLSLLCLSLFLRGLRYGLKQTGWAAERQNRYFFITAAILLLWLAFTGTLAYLGIFSNFEVLPPPMFINLTVPIIGIIIWIRQKSTKEILAGIPLFWLPAAQSFRIIVEILLWLLFAASLLPKQLTFEGYNFDILSGLLGLTLAIMMYRTIRHPLRWLKLYNYVGLALLLTIVTMAILSMPTPFRQFMNEPSNEIVAQFPIVWLPAFLVPFAFALHLLSLQQTKAYTLR
ncbi:MAG: hypothetical protein AAFN10_16240 [Bacteroidota bacterium]